MPSSDDPLDFLDKKSSDNDPLSFLAIEPSEPSEPLSFLDSENKEEPTKESFWDRLGKSFAMQSQSGSPAVTPQGAKIAAKEVAILGGSELAMGAAFAPIRYLSSLSPYAPRALRFLTELMQTGATGATAETAQSLIDTGELPTKEELLKEGSLWAGLDLAVRGTHLATRFGSFVNEASENLGISRKETIRRIWEGAKIHYGWNEPKVDPKTGMSIIHPKQIEDAVTLAEKRPEILTGDFAVKPEQEPLEVALADVEEPVSAFEENQPPIIIQPEHQKEIQKRLNEKFLPEWIDRLENLHKNPSLENLRVARNLEYAISINEGSSEEVKNHFRNEYKKTTGELIERFPNEEHWKESDLLKTEQPQLTEQQIRNRKIAEAERKKTEVRRAEELEDKKSQAEKERLVAFKALGIDTPSRAASDIKEDLLPSNEDAENLESDEEQMLSPDEQSRAQAFEESLLMKDKVSNKLQGIFSKIDIESPFNAVNAPNTGRAVKTFHDTQNAYLEEVKGVIQQLGNLKLSNDELWDSFLAAETGVDLPKPEMNQARDLIRDYFDRSFSTYHEEGGLSLPWPQSAIQRLEQNIVDLKTRLSLSNIKKQSSNKIENEIINIRKTISLLDKLKYIPKPVTLITQALADVLAEVDPKYLHRFSISAHKKRTTGALSDWVAKEPKIKEVLHPFDFLGYYAGRKGRDIALLRVTKNAIDEGLASRGEKVGFKMDPIKFPALAGYNVHPALFEYINNLTNPIPFNTYDKISRLLKSTIVFDPTYIGVLLPYFRTLIQNPKFLARVPKYWKKAVYDLVNKTPDYVQFVEAGGASNPYPETKDFKAWLEKEKLNNGSLQQVLYNSILTKEGAKDLFNKIADFSWMMERLARLAYYNMLLDKGFPVSDAAKLSAENFVDYSKLPAKTRRWLGRIFFAPVTQLLMVINDFVLEKAPFKLAASFMKDKNNFKNDRINKERTRNLIGTMIVLGGISALYKAFGFKEEEFGTRYTAEFEDKDGKQKEVVVTPIHSLNYQLRWINTYLRGFGPGESSPTQKLWGRLMGQIGPFPNLVTELGENKDFNGKKIWDPVGDGMSTILAKIMKHTLSKIEPFSVQKFHTPEEKKYARGKVKELMGWTEWFMDSIEFLYERKPEQMRKISKVKYLRREVKRLAKEGTLTEDARERYQKAIDEMLSSSEGQ